VSNVTVRKWLQEMAPGAADHLADARRLAASLPDAELVELARCRVRDLLAPGASSLGTGEEDRFGASLSAEKAAALRHWPTSPLFSKTERACLGLAEQFVIDVSAVGDADTEPVLEALGPAGLYGFVQALWVIDMSERLERCLGAALGDSSRTEEVQ
jgi:alkylhydroperoxidase family enzyme